MQIPARSTEVVATVGAGHDVSLEALWSVPVADVAYLIAALVAPHTPSTMVAEGACGEELGLVEGLDVALGATLDGVDLEGGADEVAVLRDLADLETVSGNSVGVSHAEGTSLVDVRVPEATGILSEAGTVVGPDRALGATEALFASGREYEEERAECLMDLIVFEVDAREGTKEEEVLPPLTSTAELGLHQLHGASREALRLRAL